MFRSVLVVLVLVGTVACRPEPVQPEAELVPEPSTLIQEAAKAKKPPLNYKLIGYVRNLKKFMEERLRTRFNFLSARETKRARVILNQFLLRFANDLKQVMIQAKAGVMYRKKLIEDNMKDSTFNIVRQRIRSEFPKMGDNAIEELVYRLRKNILWTRFKIDTIIHESRHLSYVSGDSDYEGPGLALVDSV